MKYTKNDAIHFVKLINLDLSRELFTIDDLIYGLNVEAEHGFINKQTNVTNDDLITTGKIALAHLNEFPDYYKRLRKMETDAEKYWKNKPKKVGRKYKLIKSY